MKDVTEEKGTINIGAGNTIMQRYLMPYIKEFHELYPNINVIVHTLVTDELIKKAQICIIDQNRKNNIIIKNFTELLK